MTALAFCKIVLVFLSCINNKFITAVRAGYLDFSLVSGESKSLFTLLAFYKFVRLSLTEFVLRQGKAFFDFADKYQIVLIFFCTHSNVF